ncbi:hypothetical protein ACQP10_37885 (plasmid) [Streptosporangium sandarakinum]|uniref:hypothetical protein n=1 Tax=Streptosporangium sandarakinum TaxID=1260955 RepID=UPI003D8C5AF3
MYDDLNEHPGHPQLTGRHLIELLGLVLMVVGAAVTTTAVFFLHPGAGWVVLGGWLFGAGVFAASGR